MAKQPHTPLPADIVRLLREADEIDVQPGPSLGRRTIWVVVVDDAPYIRSLRGADGHWYLHALAGRRATLVVAGRPVPVAVEPVVDRELQERVSAAYRDKYMRRWPEDTVPMLAPSSEAATLRIVAP